MSDAPNTVRPELVEGLSLVCHPDTPSSGVKSVWVRIHQTDEDDMSIEFNVAHGGGLLLPAWEAPARTDGLWTSTCFELFVRKPGADDYWEYNFSPSTRWAAYHFNAYREGGKDFPLDVEPMVESPPPDDLDEQNRHYQIDIDVDLGGVPSGPLEIALSAVIEEKDGRKSYWALAHPPGKPDFHHPDCFQLTLGAPRAA